MVDWIRDVDTGELYPVESDFNYDPPAHLETPEYQTIDYDKTRQMTIEQLQNQLIAAQNHIEAIENEKTFDNNSIATVNDFSAEIVSESGFKKNRSEWILIIVLYAVCIMVLILGIYAFSQENDIEINIPNISSQQTVDYEATPISEAEQSEPKEKEQQEPPKKQQDNNLINEALNYVQPLLVILCSVGGIRLVTSFLKKSIY